MTDSAVPRFGSWLSSTRELQETAFGLDYSGFSTDGDAPKVRALNAYITWNLFAIVDEIAEVNQERTWKPWDLDTEASPRAHRDNIMKEMVDVLHFAANILAAIGVSDEELSTFYSDKQERNRLRQMVGYSTGAVGVKCRSCGRAIDDIGPSEVSPGMCAMCGD